MKCCVCEENEVLAPATTCGPCRGDEANVVTTPGRTLRETPSGGTQPSPQPGDLIGGQYRLQSRLGQGGMAVVFLAEDIELRRLVAVKFILETMHASPLARERFMREAQMMARLEHPNALPIYGVGMHREVPYLVSKYLEGDTLAALSRREGRMPPKPVFDLVRQAASALDAIHARGIVHRDVKPSNLLVSPQGHLWLIDFGIARDVDHQLTSSGELVGTALYAAPEMLVGETIDARVDQYALALVAYALLTAEFPFGGRTDFERAREKLKGVTAAVLWAHLPAPARAVFVRALSPAPELRFASCGELVTALEQAYAPIHEVTDVRAVRSPTTGRRWGRPAALLVSLVLVIGTAAAWRARAPAVAPVPPAPTTEVALTPAPVPLEAPPEFPTADLPDAAVVVREEDPTGPERAKTTKVPNTKASSPKHPTLDRQRKTVTQQLSFQATIDGRTTFSSLFVDGSRVCDVTPCAPITLAAGRHTVLMQRKVGTARYQGEVAVQVPSPLTHIVVPLGRQ